MADLSDKERRVSYGKQLRRKAPLDLKGSAGPARQGTKGLGRQQGLKEKKKWKQERPAPNKRWKS